jgi:hypothetical protein
MPLGAAHRLAPEAAFLDPELEADATTLEAAFERLATFSPGLAGPTHPADPAFGRLEVHVDGLDRLWGPEPVLVGRLVDALGPVMPGPPRAGIAGTRFAASVAALHATSPPEPRLVPPGDEAAFLGPFPAALLTPDPDVRARLARFGLRRIEAVAALPRSALIARFGSEGERVHGRANGQEIERFHPRHAPERLALGFPIEPAVEELEPLRFVFHRLAGALAGQLLARGAAATRARLQLTLDTTFGPPGTPEILELEQRFPEPTAEAEPIERLLFARLERAPPPAPVTRLDLELLDVGPAAGQQLPLFVPQAARNARLGWQLARLALTFGEDRIRRVELGDPDAPLAENRWAWRPIDAGVVGEANG